MQLSVLDLVSVWQGDTPTTALRESVVLAQHVERLGYTRHWFAEHHNAPWQASSAPEIVIGHVASATNTMRIGSGGVMLPNHSPLKVAENFHTLQALHPGRIDLGIGRAPGTDGRTAIALRRSRQALMVDDFAEQIDELVGFLGGDLSDDHPFRGIVATPVIDEMPDIWILGSSDYGARYAAEHGFGFVFAHHISPDYAVPVLRYYHEHFKPSALLREPRAILAASVFCSDDPALVEDISALHSLLFARLAQGQRGAPPTVEEARAFRSQHTDTATYLLPHQMRSVVGVPEVVREKLADLAEQTYASEVMLMTIVPDHETRRRSYTLVAEAFGLQPRQG